MKSRQYTIRNVPHDVDRALRNKARQRGVSLNQVLLDSLARSVSESAGRHHDLDELAGTWKADKAFDEAVEAFGQVDPKDWQ